MASEAPPFWWEAPDWRARALVPASALYGWVAARRMRNARREPVGAPVLCVGNFTVGGSGKTPLTIALSTEARRMGLKPGILSRGHGGSGGHARLVDAAHDSARSVGDEPLLLAAAAPVAVTPDRAQGARLLIAEGCDFLIMDDGFQSARILIDFALVAVDGRYGLGNGHVIPAGPLRAPLMEQIRHADAVVRIGHQSAGDVAVRQAARAAKPVFEAAARTRHPERFAGRRFLAFAGIGHPEKFFDTVTAAGATVALARGFPDHHVYGSDELSELAETARKAELTLLTTEKDAARLRHGAAPDGFLDALSVLEIDMVFDDPGAPARIIGETLEAWRRRRSRM